MGPGSEIRSGAWLSNAVGTLAGLRDAMKKMDDTGIPIVLVVDHATDALLGTITDGDIRRWILSGGNLDAQAMNVMNLKPWIEYVDGPNEAMPSWVMLVPQVQYLSGRVVGLRDLRKPRQQNLVVIMAGGLGTRLRPLTDETPKPMLHVGGKPILQRLVEQFVAQGFSEIFISVGYKAEVIKDYFGEGRFGASIKYLEELSALGTAGALALLPKTIHPVIVVNGDVVTDVPFSRLLDFHMERDASATIAVTQYRMRVPYGVIQTDGEKLVAVIEKPDLGVYVNAGMYVLGREALALAPRRHYQDAQSIYNSQEFGGLQNHQFNMPDLFSRLIDSKKPPVVFPILEKWLDVGSPETLAQAQMECVM